jgi:hypothetical protein
VFWSSELTRMYPTLWLAVTLPSSNKCQDRVYNPYGLISINSNTEPKLTQNKRKTVRQICQAGVCSKVTYLKLVFILLPCPVSWRYGGLGWTVNAGRIGPSPSCVRFKQIAAASTACGSGALTAGNGKLGISAAQNPVFLNAGKDDGREILAYRSTR